MNELYQQFLQLLKESKSAEFFTADELTKLGEEFKNADEEQLQQAIEAIKANNANREKLDQEATTREQKLAGQLKQQIKVLNRTELHFEESVDKEESNAEAEELIQGLNK